MGIKLAKLLCECNDEFSLYENYSGRGMFGKKTTGVFCPSLSMVLTTVLANADLFVDDEGYPLFENEKLSCDNMGVSFIVY